MKPNSLRVALTGHNTTDGLLDGRWLNFLKKQASTMLTGYFIQILYLIQVWVSFFLFPCFSRKLHWSYSCLWKGCFLVLYRIIWICRYISSLLEKLRVHLYKKELEIIVNAVSPLTFTTTNTRLLNEERTRTCPYFQFWIWFLVMHPLF